MLKGFKDFLLRGNVVDLAVAVVIGAAFTAVVTAFTNAFLKPLIQLFSGGGQFAGKFLVNGVEFDYATYGGNGADGLTFFLYDGTTTAAQFQIGAFGGMVRVPAGMRKPTLVLSTDGVGTKVLVAWQVGRFDTVGEDLELTGGDLEMGRGP